MLNYQGHRNLKRSRGGTLVEGHRPNLNMLKSLSGNLEGQLDAFELSMRQFCPFTVPQRVLSSLRILKTHCSKTKRKITQAVLSV